MESDFAALMAPVADRYQSCICPLWVTNWEFETTSSDSSSEAQADQPNGQKEFDFGRGEMSFVSSRVFVRSRSFRAGFEIERNKETRPLLLTYYPKRDRMNQSDFTECEQFEDHRRAICRGERSDLSLATINQYRELWGLGPLCGGEAVSRSAPSSTFPARAQMIPSLTRRVVTFVAALTGHAQDGFLKCDAAEIAARLAICQQCPSFTGTRCRECGCACNADKIFFNKLAWRSERCPLGRW